MNSAHSIPGKWVPFVLFGGTACIKARRKYGLSRGKRKMFNHPYPSCPWGASEAGGVRGRGYLRSLGLGRGLVLRGIRAHGPDLEYCHTWVCAFTEWIRTNLYHMKKLVSQRSECSNRELLTFQFEMLHGTLKDKT